MHIYCIEKFKKEFLKLISKSSYKHLESEVIEYFFNKSIQGLLSGARLNNSDETPYIKKRLGGSGGFRVYFLVLIKKDSLYLMYVHPKSGSRGANNMNDESKALIYKEVLSCIGENQLYKLSLNGGKIVFTKC